MMHGNKLSHLLPLRVKKKNLQISKNIIIIKKKKKKKKLEITNSAIRWRVAKPSKPDFRFA